MGFRLWGFGFEGQGLGCRVYGLGAVGASTLNYKDSGFSGVGDAGVRLQWLQKDPQH